MMKIKNIRYTRLMSSFFVLVSTIVFLFTYQHAKFINYFNETKRQYILIFVNVGILLCILGSYLALRTFKQFKRNKEVVQKKQEDRGIYRLVRNPIYSSVLLISSGVLLLTCNYFSLLLIVAHWILLNLIIIFLEEPRLIEQLDSDYLEYTLQVNRLIPWFGKYFKTKEFSERDQIYLKKAEDYLDREIQSPVMGYYFQSLVKSLWFRKGIFFITEKEVVFYSYDVFRGHYAQMIPFTKVSSFVYGKNNFGYSLRVFASGTMINLYFVQKGEFEDLVRHIKYQLHM